MPDMELAQDTRMAQNFQGDPPLGPILRTGLRRAVFGWTHTTDTPRGYRRGIIWCSVSGEPHEGPPKAKFQVFDTSGNRARFKGVRVYCGVANFSMVKMIHPYWCPNGEIPQDMGWEDKARCRALYHDLIALEGTQYANGGGDDDSDNDDDDGDDDARRERREYRAFNAEENRILFDNEGNRRRRSIGFRQRMARRNARAMQDQYDELKRKSDEAKDRRTRDRLASSARVKSDRRSGTSRSGSSGINRRRTTRALLQDMQKQMRREYQERTGKTKAPSSGSEWSDLEVISDEDDNQDRRTGGLGSELEFLSDDEGDIMHGGEDQDEDDMERRRAALDYHAFADGDLDPNIDLNDPEAAGGTGMQVDDEDSDNRSSHRMFVDQGSDTNSNNGGNAGRMSRLSTPASSIVDMIKGDNHNGKKDRSSATPNSNGSRSKSVKSEPDVKPDVEVLDAMLLDGSDPDIMFTGANALKPMFQGHGQGSAEDPMVFDD